MHDLWLRQRIAAVLADAGYQVVEAPDGVSDVRRAEQHQPDAILLSGKLPELDGGRNGRRVAQSAAHLHYPVSVHGEGVDPLPQLARFSRGSGAGRVALHVARTA